MHSNNLWNRRSMMKAVGIGVTSSLASVKLAAKDQVEPHKTKGNIKQSVCQWCYHDIPLQKLTTDAQKMGYQSIELLGPDDILKVKKLGLTCAMVRCSSIPDGLNRKENHDRIEKELTRHINFAADEGIPNVICMAGNRKGLADDEGMKVCAEGLKRVLGLAEKKKVTICMEGLNSKVDHKDYMYDKTIWGVNLCKMLGSDRFKLLYDIYHMQIMEGDVIRNIRDYHQYIAHYHTGGNPGRNEIDDTQELNYPAIVKAILATGYKGFLGQEFIPKPQNNPMKSLAQGFQICDV